MMFLYFQVFGVGTANPYRLRPYLGARVPVNSSFASVINMHNPHSTPLQVSFAMLSYSFNKRFATISYTCTSQ